MAEKLRCNICSCEIDQADAMEHVGTQRHAGLKSKLEQELDTTMKKEYANDVSVALQWSESSR